MHQSLRVVNERFHEVRELMARLFERDTDFRDLCEDYEACADTVTRLQLRGSASEAMRTEYTALLLRLERELLRYLEEHPDRAAS
jgi:uncharacterized protein YdcH (DUF465 family)